jgi:hypothetical protein
MLTSITQVTGPESLQKSAQARALKEKTQAGSPLDVVGLPQDQFQLTSTPGTQPLAEAKISTAPAKAPTLQPEKGPGSPAATSGAPSGNLALTTLVTLEEPALSPAVYSPPMAGAEAGYKSTIASLGEFLEIAKQRGAQEGVGVNESRPDLFEAKVEELWKTLNSDELKSKAKADPYLQPMLTQVTTNLKHVRLDFVRRDETYVHKDALPGPYTFEPTLGALKSVRDFFRVLDAGEAAEVKATTSPGQVQVEIKELETKQKDYIKTIIDSPLEHYNNFRARLAEGGPQTPFPEFADMVRYLELHLDKEGPLTQASGNKHLAVARQITGEALSKVKESGYPYRETIDTVQEALGFLDVYERGRPESQARPQLYHSNRYQYYSHFIKAETPDHVLFPTIYGLGATDLLKTRGVPIGFVGVPAEVSWVDGYTQTPLEFFNHDINHVRRMWQFTKEHAEEMNVPLQDYVVESDRYVREDLIPLIKINKGESADQKNEKRMMKLILFEALHEDALPAHPNILRNSLMRAPNTMTPFEELINDEKRVRYLMEPGATTTAYVYRKAAGMFYDMPSMRMENIVGVNYRTQDFVAESAKTLSKRLNLGVSEELIDAYTRDDTGMPNDFRFQLEQQLSEDPNRMAPLKMKGTTS